MVPLDIRAGPARFYDSNPHHLNDIPFYLERLPYPGARVLELGCGTGRVSIPLARHCGFLHGVDLSMAMLEECRSKIQESGLGDDRITVSKADIADFDLEARFDLIIAPFRVMQNLETDAQLSGLFQGIRRHLSEGGRCILNVFHPNRDPETLRKEWVSEEENLAWEVHSGEERIACFDVRRGLSTDPLILYPDLVYRRYLGETMVDEEVLSVPMRCYYPGEFSSLITSEGFEIQGKWGGYSGEEYGGGKELVIEFSEGSGSGAKERSGVAPA